MIIVCRSGPDDAWLPAGNSIFCRSGLVRDLPGTGSKTCAQCVSVTTKVTGFRAASQPIAVVVTS
ncbi:hypothetical protein B0B36_05885 [Pseudomonas syringae pv. actinidifoliorum]|nr:hypothetical protein B0B36_05885 [Pseudomonas syringae pv. actinidifoliorum]